MFARVFESSLFFCQLAHTRTCAHTLTFKHTHTHYLLEGLGAVGNGMTGSRAGGAGMMMGDGVGGFDSRMVDGGMMMKGGTGITGGPMGMMGHMPVSGAPVVMNQGWGNNMGMMGAGHGIGAPIQAMGRGQAPQAMMKQGMGMPGYNGVAMQQQQQMLGTNGASDPLAMFSNPTPPSSSLASTHGFPASSKPDPFAGLGF